MKSFFTLLFVSAFSFLSAQDLSFNLVDVQLDAGEDLDYGDIILTNNGTSTLDLALRLENLCIVDGDETKIQICVGLECYFPVNTTYTWGDDTTEPIISIGPGESSDILKFSQLPAGSFASEWNVVVYDRNDEANKATIHIVIDDDTLAPCAPVSTDDFAYEIGTAFPNPASETINISYQTTNNAQLNIYNTLGIQMESIEVSPQNESVAVDVSNYTNGVYFYQITDGKDQSRTLSFVK